MSMLDSGLSPMTITYNTLINKADNFAQAEQVLKQVVSRGFKPNVLTYNVLLNRADNAIDAANLFNFMVEEKISPTLATYNILTNKASTFEDAELLLSKMSEQGVDPDVVSFNTVIKKAKSYPEAQRVFSDMIRMRVRPNVITLNTLITRSETFGEAKALMRKMNYEYDVEPDWGSYSALYRKDLSEFKAEQILEQILRQPNYRDSAIDAAIESYRKAGQINRALRLAGDYTHVRSSRALIREYPKESISFFTEFENGNPEHPNAACSMGTALSEIGEQEKALPYLRKALTMAGQGKRREALTDLIVQIERSILRDSPSVDRVRRNEATSIADKIR